MLAYLRSVLDRIAFRLGYVRRSHLDRAVELLQRVGGRNLQRAVNRSQRRALERAAFR